MIEKKTEQRVGFFEGLWVLFVHGAGVYLSVFDEAALVHCQPAQNIEQQLVWGS